MADTNINMLILGQTGSGKSTLLNYLYGNEKVKKGAGKVVTEYGDFTSVKIPSPSKPGVTVTILDSWGLEANKAEDWKKLINDKLIATLSYADMICAIVYCISYSKDRIHEFEIARLKELLEKGYKIVIAMTHADNGGFPSKKVTFRETLEKGLPEYRQYYDVVDICSESKKKIGTSVPTVTFGKEELFNQIEKDVSVNFIKVFMANIQEWRIQSLKKIDAFYAEYKGAIDSGSNSNLKDRAKLIQSEIKHLARDILDLINTAIEDAKSFYSDVGGSFTGVRYPDWNWDDILLGVGNLLKNMFETWKNILTGGSVVKEQLEKRLNEAIESLRTEVENRFKQAEEIGEKIRRRNA